MNLYKDFKKSFTPVIHVTDNIDNVYKNIEICIDANADGVFLISHGYLNYKKLLKLGLDIKQKYPTLWIGYNFLDLENTQVFSELIESQQILDGIWIDDSLVGINLYESKANKIKDGWREYKRLAPNCLYFGGVAFKYCKQPIHLDEAVESAMQFMDIVTTSGDGTGIEASLPKIKTFFDNLNDDTKVALASGVSIDNVKGYLPYVDVFMVSSSISDSHDVLNKEKTITLSNMIHDFKNYTEIELDKKYWDEEQNRWDTHNALKTTSHEHIDSFENGWFELLLVEINDGEYYYINNVNCDINNPFVFDGDDNTNSKVKAFYKESEARFIAEKIVKELDKED